MESCGSKVPADLVTFTEEILNGKLHSLCSVNCFCGKVNRRKVLSFISSRGHYQRFSPSQVSDTRRTGYEPAQSLTSGVAESIFTTLVTTIPRHHYSKISRVVLKNFKDSKNLSLIKVSVVKNVSYVVLTKLNLYI